MASQSDGKVENCQRHLATDSRLTIPDSFLLEWILANKVGRVYYNYGIHKDVPLKYIPAKSSTQCITIVVHRITSK